MTRHHLSHLLSVILLIVAVAGSVAGCRTRERVAQAHLSGRTYDLTDGSALHGTIVRNLRSGHCVAADSLGAFSIRAAVGDTIRFEYIGMKPELRIVDKASSSIWAVGLDTLSTALVGNPVICMSR